MPTPSDHAQADLRISNPKISADFIEALMDAAAPKPGRPKTYKKQIQA